VQGTEAFPTAEENENGERSAKGVEVEDALEETLTSSVSLESSELESGGHSSDVLSGLSVGESG